MVVKVHLLIRLAEEIPVEERGLPVGLENALFSQIWNRGTEKIRRTLLAWSFTLRGMFEPSKGFKHKFPKGTAQEW